jgi:excisionase family DNA binding protein
MPSYKAIIEGREREILGWTDRDTLALADGGQLALVALEDRLDDALKGKVWRIARLKYEDGKWWLDGKTLASVWCNPSDKPEKSVARKTDVKTIDCLAELLADRRLPTATFHNAFMERRAFRANVVAVAWFEDRFEEVSEGVSEASVADKPRPMPKRYLPIFLSRCDFIVSRQNQTVSTDNPPDWFTSYASAAKYANKTTRTIRNWIRNDWLKGVEKKGRKIRIPRAELDKCIKRQ